MTKRKSPKKQPWLQVFWNVFWPILLTHGTRVLFDLAVSVLNPAMEQVPHVLLV